MIQKALKEFKIESSIYKLLSQDERKLIPILNKICKLTSEIYLLQEDINEKRCNFYPKDVSDNQIKAAAKSNPEILSPYTIIEKKGEKLVAIPFHTKYQDKLKLVCELLNKASLITKNKSFSNYLKVASRSLLSGDYESLDRAWLKIKDNSLIFLVGPYERCLDKRFFTKMCYLAFVGIIDPYYTQKVRRIRQIFFTNIGENHDRYTIPQNIRAIAIYNTVLAGYLARVLFSSEHIPSNDLTIRKFGSKVLGYLSTINYKFDHLLYPIFNTIFDKEFKKLYSEEVLRKSCYYLMLVYGLARQLHRYKGARERLKELFPIFDEANSMVSGIKHSKYLVLKGVINQKELEAMIIMHICWIFSEWVFAKTSKCRNDYLEGDTLTLNFYLKQNALLESHGISWPNFSKIFFTIEDLANTFVMLLSKGSYSHAQNFLKDNLSYKVFTKFDPKLSKVIFPI